MIFECSSFTEPFKNDEPVGDVRDLSSDERKKEKIFLCIMMELCKTTLFKVLGEKAKATELLVTSHWMWVVETLRGIACGLDYLHNQSK